MLIASQLDCDRALALFPETGGTQDGLTQLRLYIHLHNHENRTTHPLSRAVVRLSAAYSMLLTVLHRHHWQKEQYRDSCLDPMAYISFAGCDVEHFYILFRSFCDEFALVTGRLSTQPGQVPPSFHRLQKWCIRTARARKLVPPALVDLITSCTWFMALRETRDAIIHHGAETLALPQQDTIGYRIRTGRKRASVPGFLMLTDDLINFEQLLVWVIGSAAIMVDTIGRLGVASLGQGDGPIGYSTTPAIALVRADLLSLHSRLPHAGA